MFKKYENNEQSKLPSNEPSRFDMSNDEILNEKLSENTRKGYWSSIRKMVEHMTEAERKDYITKEGFLSKSLHPDIIDHVMRESQFVGDKNGVRKWKSVSSYNCYNSALSFWHKESNRRQPKDSIPIKMDSEAKDRINELSVSRKRILARDNAEKGEEEATGKRSVTFSDYKFLASLAFSDPTCGLLCHPSILLGWNLMGRSNAISTLSWNNLAVCDDSITVFYHKSKTNQEGDK